MTQQILRLAYNAVHAKLLDADPQLKREVASMLSFQVSGAEHSDAFKSHRWDGRSSFFDFPTCTFPAGFVHPVHSFLAKKGYRVQLVRKPMPEPLGPSVKECDATIDSFGGDARYQYQIETIERLERYGMMIARCATGCHAKGTEILMYDGTLKKVEDVVVGDALMGPDSRPRNVMALHRGRDRMYRIAPKRKGVARPFVVNAGHILSLQGERGESIEVTADEVFSRNDRWRRKYRLYKSTALEFSGEVDLPIPAYILGVLLGDGLIKSYQCRVTSADREIVEEVRAYAKSVGMRTRERETNGALHINIVGPRSDNSVPNNLKAKLKALGLYGCDSRSKFVPDSYRRSSKKNRLDLLAGLLDTDGSLSSAQNSFVFSTVNERLADDVMFLCGSLGIGSSKTRQGRADRSGVMFVVSISGACEQIPTRIARKKFVRKPLQKAARDPLLFAYTIEPVDEADYYGFEVDGDHLYVMQDFIVTHNSGKSRIAKLAFMRLGRPALFLTTRGVLMYQMKETFEAMGRKCGIMGDGQFEPRRGCNVGMVQTIAARLKNEATRQQMLDILAIFELVILEEAHESGGNEYYEILTACKNAHYRLALTATPFMRADEEANMRLMAVAGPIGIEVTEKQLIDSGILATPHFKIVPTSPVPKVKRTSSWLRAYEYGIMKHEGRNAHIVFEVKRATALNLPAMVLIQRKEHGAILEKMMIAAGIRARFIFGDNSQDERKLALKQLGNGELQCLIGSTILDVGVDVPSVGLVVLAGGGKAEVAHRQRIGRGLRAKKNGPNVCFIVDFEDTINSHLRDHAGQRENIIRTTPGFAERILPAGTDFDFKGLGVIK